ncbi:MAG TPA: twitching motility protein, partial [Planctomycetes bacterium]|nr:twitching motility protein [Planctomycetota bacterium]
DPDVILVGEVRALDTIRTAIVAAETGHLVFTTVHASDCVSAVERLVAVFPADEQAGIRGQLALTLRAVVAQRLLPADGPRGQAGERRRVVVSEVLRVNSGVANLIAQGKPAQVYSLMETGAAAGNQTFDQDLARLLGEGLISEQAAKVLARSPQSLADQVKHGAKRRLVGRRGRP